MVDIRLKHYVVRKGRGYWLVTPKMRAYGFENVRCGVDGPGAWAVAKEWEERWQRARKGLEAPRRKVYPKDSAGDGFERFRRTNEWQKKPPRTREDWDRGWAYIEPIFGDLPPARVSLEMLDQWYQRLTDRKGAGEAGRAMKTWRALYNVLAAMKLCPAGQDPSLAIRKTSVAGRTATWREGEAVRLVKASWRAGYRGLACIIAIAWDTSFSPVDARTLTPDHAVAIGDDWAFRIGRGKTGEAAIGILSKRTQALVQAYLAGLPYDLIDHAPIFRTRGSGTTPKGGRPQAPAVYTKNKLAEDFREIRAAVLGKDESRKLMDMRRTGSVEANAGGASVEAISAKLGNSIDRNKTLQKVYMPVDVASVRAADESRKIGRQKLASEQNEFKKLKLTAGKS